MNLSEMYKLIREGKVLPEFTTYEIYGVHFLKDQGGEIYSDYDHEYWEILEGHDKQDEYK